MSKWLNKLAENHEYWMIRAKEAIEQGVTNMRNQGMTYVPDFQHQAEQSGFNIWLGNECPPELKDDEEFIDNTIEYLNESGMTIDKDKIIRVLPSQEEVDKFFADNNLQVPTGVMEQAVPAGGIPEELESEKEEGPALSILSPNDIAERKDKALDDFNAGKIDKDKLHQVLLRYSMIKAGLGGIIVEADLKSKTPALIRYIKAKRPQVTEQAAQELIGEINSMDPTGTIGKYTPWLVYRYFDNFSRVANHNSEIAKDLKDYLDLTKAGKATVDITKMKSLDELAEFVEANKKFLPKKVRQKVGPVEGSQKIWSDGKYQLYKVTSLEAVQYYCNYQQLAFPDRTKTQPCVQFPEHFKRYMGLGNLYILMAGTKFELAVSPKNTQTPYGWEIRDINDGTPDVKVLEKFIEPLKAIGKIEGFSLEIMTLLFKGESNPEYEALIKDHPKSAYAYASSRRKPFPEGEAAIATDALYSFKYAKNVLKGPFPAGEDIIAMSAGYSYEYATIVLKGPFLKGEDVINKHSYFGPIYNKFLVSIGKSNEKPVSLEENNVKPQASIRSKAVAAPPKPTDTPPEGFIYALDTSSNTWVLVTKTNASLNKLALFEFGSEFTLDDLYELQESVDDDDVEKIDSMLGVMGEEEGEWDCGTLSEMSLTLRQEIDRREGAEGINKEESVSDEEPTDNAELDKGIEVEKEHEKTIRQIETDAEKDELKTLEEYLKMVAQDHIQEVSNYYSLLEKYIETKGTKVEGETFQQPKPGADMQSRLYGDNTIDNITAGAEVEDIDMSSMPMIFKNMENYFYWTKVVPDADDEIAYIQDALNELSGEEVSYDYAEKAYKRFKNMYRGAGRKFNSMRRKASIMDVDDKTENMRGADTTTYQVTKDNLNEKLYTNASGGDIDIDEMYQDINIMYSDGKDVDTMASFLMEKYDISSDDAISVVEDAMNRDSVPLDKTESTGMSSGFPDHQMDDRTMGEDKDREKDVDTSNMVSMGSDEEAINEDEGPSDADVQDKAWEMFQENWHGLGSKEMDEVYRALGYDPVTMVRENSLKKSADPTIKYLSDEELAKREKDLTESGKRTTDREGANEIDIALNEINDEKRKRQGGGQMEVNPNQAQTATTGPLVDEQGPLTAPEGVKGSLKTRAKKKGMPSDTYEGMFELIPDILKTMNKDYMSESGIVTDQAIIKYLQREVGSIAGEDLTFEDAQLLYRDYLNEEEGEQEADEFYPTIDKEESMVPTDEDVIYNHEHGKDLSGEASLKKSADSLNVNAPGGTRPESYMSQEELAKLSTRVSKEDMVKIYRLMGIYDGLIAQHNKVIPDESGTGIVDPTWESKDQSITKRLGEVADEIEAIKSKYKEEIWRKQMLKSKENWIQKVSGFFSYPWDKGSPWKTVETQDGKKQIIRETEEDKAKDIQVESDNKKQARYPVGSKIVMLNTLFNDSGIVRAIDTKKGIYKVQNTKDGKSYLLGENDMADSTENAI